MFTKVTLFALFGLYLPTIHPVLGQTDDLKGMITELLNERVGQNRKSRPEIFLLSKSRTVQNDLELIPNQVGQLAQINEEFDRQRQLLAADFVSKLRVFETNNTPVDKNFLAGFEAERGALEDGAKNQIEELLLPQQLKRLHEIAFQVHVQLAGHGSAIVHPETAPLLKISDEQKTRIIKRSTEISKKIEENIRKLREDAREELLSELTSKQRELLNEVTGETIELSDEFLKRIKLAK